MAQSFFTAGENGFLVTRLDVDHAVWRQARLRQCRREEVLAGDTPQHLSARPRSDAAREKGSSRTVDRAISTPGHFMQGAQRQPTPREMPVDVSEAEGKHAPMARGGTFKALDSLAKFHDGRTGIGRTHAPCNALGRWYVLYLFSYGSKSQLASLPRVALKQKMMATSVQKHEL